MKKERKFTRKLLLPVLAASVALPSVAAFAPQVSYAKEKADDFVMGMKADYIEEFIQVLKGLTPEGKAQLRQVRDSIQEKSLIWWRDTVIQNPQFIEAAKQKGVTVEEATFLLRDFTLLFYTPDNLQENLLSFKQKHSATLQKLFGNEFGIKDLLDFVKDISKQIIADLMMDHMVDTNKPLDDIVDDAVKRTLEHGKYKKFANKLAELTLSIDEVIQMRKRLAAEIDPNNVARNAFLQAFIRKNVTLSIQPGRLVPGKTKQLTVNVSFPRKISIRSGVTWESSNPEVATVNRKGELTAHKPGTTTITAKLKSIDVGKLDVTVEPKKDKDKEEKDKNKEEKDKKNNDKKDRN
ncbi:MULTISPECIES: Ig-like domain-containing protein [Aneurinibacillus]|uniref:Ig-like domain-containing protein n=1 Tax=Aneurinibacillus thermoaerophilus TaxID=143495 RepID=A0ABX8YB00_ANETH|nr:MULTISPECIES: Ig-like domain-containing protein [Aneurinibacillus]AMA71685.1 hypothetical protein ACH33_01745 [Aneurinibacillus sp. XH2]MED0676135.1 Ig-like domain-containing protein [Aneurinibacillus thermoaerophilus]MED0738400.1 Ig-like domain-containing protein [Aneurinibacillus thermoaerophilus]MED0757672.1 Ig-like domain-containing protein [Aneurinibacillus thermoaerophilus]MED0759311.1 Ig-like domain-containing protein [Aneurinibacillus thermoaerophilus]